MFKLFKKFTFMSWMLVIIIIFVTGQAVAELFLPEKMSEIIDYGIYIDYQPLYKHVEMEKPRSISSIDSEKTLKGYDSDKIPVFEMIDGFSTYDLAQTLGDMEGTTFKAAFKDIPVRDSQELFDNVMTPFLDGLKPFQRKGAKYYDYSTEDQRIIREVVGTLFIFELLPITEEAKKEEDLFSIDELLDQEDDPDEDAMENSSNKKIITACILNMKHSRYGNIMPIPIDKDGKRLATDEFGEAIDQSKLIYVYSDKDDNEVGSRKESFTKRPDEMPDYETIIANGVLGFAYKFKTQKWQNHELGKEEEDANDYAAEANRQYLINSVLKSHEDYFQRIPANDTSRFYNRYQELEGYLGEITKIYTTDDDLVILGHLLTLKNAKNPKKVERLITSFYMEKPETLEAVQKIDKNKAQQFFIKLRHYLKLSPAGQRADEAVKELKTGKDMLMPDGFAPQTKDMTFILTRGGYMLLLTVTACIGAIVAALVSSKFTADFSARIRSLIFGKVESFSLLEFDKFTTSSLITRSTNDINQIQSIILLVLRTGLIAPITLIGGFIMAFEKSPKMTTVLAYDMPFLAIVTYIAVIIVYPLFRLIQKKIDKLTLVARESLTGIRVIRAFNKQEYENERFKEINDSLTRTARTVGIFNAALAPVIAVVMNVSLVGVIWIASKQIAYDEDVKVGDMMAVIQYMTQIMFALVMLANVFILFPRATASALRVNEILNTTPELLDAKEPNREYKSIGSVEFRNVSFKYFKEAEQHNLKNITFKAEKGKVTAIVGGTGSGKSTILNLIPRFYDVNEGEILVDGVNVKEYVQSELREKIGLVPQRAVLFTGTIRENLQYGKRDATEEEMWEALTIAQSKNFVYRKEGKLDAPVAQGGSNFSGGQKQRLSIARAIIGDHSILMFDDSFSALDFKTDKNLRAALKPITANTATIIVAQRIGTIMDADTILVMSQGEIVGKGTHEELIRSCDVYRELALSQMSEEELGL